MKEQKAKRFFTLLIVPHDQKKIFNLKMPHWVNRFLIVGIAILILVTGIFIKSHRDLKIEVIDLRVKEELYRDQNQKIMYFSNEIENLRKEVQELRDLGTSVKGLSKKLKQSSAPAQPNPVASSSEAKKLGQGSPNLDISSPIVTEKINQDISSLKREIGQQKDVLQNLRKYLQAQLSLLRVTPNRWPLRGWITSRYGWRIFRGQREFHSGIDIANLYGTSIRTAADGTVQFSGWNGGYGKLVVINHGRGISTYYGHNSTNLVSVGQFVRKGAIVARVGETGRTTGPHLHYEVRVNDKPINPFKYLY